MKTKGEVDKLLKQAVDKGDVPGVVAIGDRPDPARSTKAASASGCSASAAA